EPPATLSTSQSPGSPLRLSIERGPVGVDQQRKEQHVDEDDSLGERDAGQEDLITTSRSYRYVEDRVRRLRGVEDVVDRLVGLVAAARELTGGPGAPIGAI